MKNYASYVLAQAIPLMKVPKQFKCDRVNLSLSEWLAKDGLDWPAADFRRSTLSYELSFADAYENVARLVKKKKPSDRYFSYTMNILASSAQCYSSTIKKLGAASYLAPQH